MPDVITEFCNLTGRTLTQLQAGVPLLTTSASQTAVIRDVVIHSQKEVPLSLRVNGTEVAQVVGSAHLNGTELVGVSSTVTLRTDDATAFNGIYAWDDSSFYTGAADTVFTSAISSLNSLDGTSTTTGIAISFTETPHFGCLDTSGNFYYSTAPGTTLYRRAGGVNGAQTQFSFGRSPVYDGTRYIYSIASDTSIARFDTQTGALASAITISASIGFNSSHGQTCFIDGALIVRNSSSSATVYIINLTTGFRTILRTFNSASSQRYHIGAAKRANGDIIVVWLDYQAPGIYWQNIGPNALSPVLGPSGSLSAVFGNLAGEQNSLWRLAPNILGTIRSSFQTLNVDTMAFSPTRSISGLTVNSYAIPYTDPARAVTDFGTITVRATGVLTT